MPKLGVAVLLTARVPSVLSEVPLLMASIFPGRRTAISIPSERPQASSPPCLVIISGDDMGRRGQFGHEAFQVGAQGSASRLVSFHEGPLGRVSRRSVAKPIPIAQACRANHRVMFLTVSP